MAVESENIWCKGDGETRNCAVSFKGLLDSGELLTGTPTVAATGLTISSIARNASTITVGDDDSVLADQAVQFTASGGTAGQMYEILITVATDGGQTLEFVQNLAVL